MSETPRPAPLSERERAVLFLAADGLTDKQISARLEITPKTVRTYWDRVRHKLSAASRTQALSQALRMAAEDALQEGQLAQERAKALLQLVFDSVRQPLWMVDAEFRTVHVNASMASLLGVPLEDLRSQPLTEDLKVRLLSSRERLSVRGVSLVVQRLPDEGGYLLTGDAALPAAKPL